MKTHGTVYFLVNEAMPGLVKIGHTTGDLEVRIKQLNSTGVPKPFCVIATFQVRQSGACERSIHQHLRQYRKNPRREFFAGTPQFLITQSIEIISTYLEADYSDQGVTHSADAYIPDKDDIYFMFFLLHDCYEDGSSYSSTELAVHHEGYSPIELDLKLIDLETHGYVKRINRGQGGVGKWSLSPIGLKFMIEGGHHDQTLLNESRLAR